MRFGKQESCNVCDKHEFKFSSSELLELCRERIWAGTDGSATNCHAMDPALFPESGGLMPVRESILALHMELHLNGCLHFHRLAIQNIRLVLPLPNRIQSRLNENWMPVYGTKVFDCSRLADRRLQGPIPLYVRDTGHLRIGRLHVMNFQTFSHSG